MRRWMPLARHAALALAGALSPAAARAVPHPGAPGFSAAFEAARYDLYGCLPIFHPNFGTQSVCGEATLWRGVIDDGPDAGLPLVSVSPLTITAPHFAYSFGPFSGTIYGSTALQPTAILLFVSPYGLYQTPQSWTPDLATFVPISFSTPGFHLTPADCMVTIDPSMCSGSDWAMSLSVRSSQIFGVVPEPATLALTGGGLLVMAAGARRGAFRYVLRRSLRREAVRP